MSLHSSSRFQIHRLHDPRQPDDHYRVFWRIDGRAFRVHVWGPVGWERMRALDQLRDAIQLEGGGSMALRPMAVSWDEEAQLVAEHMASWPVVDQRQ
jgi:hypothetical protein